MMPSVENAVYIVATPIGNLGDMTQRAAETLRAVDAIYAEDTRQTHKLLQHCGIKNTVYPLHQHNEAVQKRDIARRLDSGKAIAVVSDAGTPLIADPGYVTVAYLRQQGYRVLVVPGCSSVIAALSIAGLPSQRFQFVGFLPAKAKQRQDVLGELLYCPQTTVFFETPHRIAACLADCLALFGGERQLFIGRELTKQFEDSVLLPLSEASAWIQAREKRRKGEFVLALAPSETPETPEKRDWQRLTELMIDAGIPTKTVAQVVCAHTAEHKKAVYRHALAWRSENYG